MGANLGILPPLAEPICGKRGKAAAYAQRLLEALQKLIDSGNMGFYES